MAPRRNWSRSACGASTMNALSCPMALLRPITAPRRVVISTRNAARSPGSWRSEVFSTERLPRGAHGIKVVRLRTVASGGAGRTVKSRLPTRRAPTVMSSTRLRNFPSPRCPDPTAKGIGGSKRSQPPIAERVRGHGELVLVTISTGVREFGSSGVREFGDLRPRVFTRNRVPSWARERTTNNRAVPPRVAASEYPSGHRWSQLVAVRQRARPRCGVASRCARRVPGQRTGTKTGTNAEIAPSFSGSRKQKSPGLPGLFFCSRSGA